MSQGPRIAVIGAGLTGLAAAHRLQELSQQQQRPLKLTVWDAQLQTGGLIGTVERDGYLIDTGADSFITNKPRIIPLCERLGLQSALQATDSRYRGALVLAGGRPQPVPEGFQLLSPSAAWPILRTPILSWHGKLRLLAEYFVPRGVVKDDESLASFVRRRFGREALDRLVQPLVGGIYTSDPETLSLRATLPRFLDMEQQYGSLIRASCQRRTADGADDQRSSGARYGLFAGLQQGMGQLTATLAQRVASQSELATGVRVQRVLAPNGSAPDAGRFRLEIQGTAPRDFDGVIVTLPTFRAAELLETLDARLAISLRQIEYASSAIVVSGHALADIQHPLNSFGLVIPHRERRKILAVSFSSRKFPNRAPSGHVLLRTFVGGALQPELLDRDDAELTELVQTELRALLGVTGQPDFSWVVRYPRAMPQYTLGHLQRVSEIEQHVAQHSGLQLAGNAYHGVGIPDAVASGELAAERLWNVVAHRMTPAGSSEKQDGTS